jgi:hypothetical protein
MVSFLRGFQEMASQQQTVTVLLVDVPDGWRYGFPKIVPEWLKPEQMDAWIVEQGYPRSVRDSSCPELIYRFWYKNMPCSDLPYDYYEENPPHANI